MPIDNIEYLLGLVDGKKRRYHLRPQTIFVIPQAIVFHIGIRCNKKLLDIQTT